MKKKSITALLIAFIAILCFTGCSSDGQSKTVSSISLNHTNATLIKDKSAVSSNWTDSGLVVNVTYSDGSTGTLSTSDYYIEPITESGHQYSLLSPNAGGAGIYYEVYVKPGYGNSGILPENNSTTEEALENKSWSSADNNTTLKFENHSYSLDGGSTYTNYYSVEGSTKHSDTSYSAAIYTEAEATATDTIILSGYTLEGDTLTYNNGTETYKFTSSNHTGIYGIWTGSYTLVIQGDNSILIDRTENAKTYGTFKISDDNIVITPKYYINAYTSSSTDNYASNMTTDAFNSGTSTKYTVTSTSTT